VTLDLSFISVLKVMPAVAQLVSPGGQLVVLVKPQFEAGRSQVGSGGVVKDPKVGGVCWPRLNAEVSRSLDQAAVAHGAATSRCSWNTLLGVALLWLMVTIKTSCCAITGRRWGRGPAGSVLGMLGVCS
jgi:hypothetical protein